MEVFYFLYSLVPFGSVEKSLATYDSQHRELPPSMTVGNKVGQKVLKLGMVVVITVFRSTWEAKNKSMELPPIFFCIGVIGHRKSLSFYKN